MGRSLLYLDCVGGIAGDMLLAALLDAGASLDAVRNGLPELGINVRVDRVERAGLAAALLVVDGTDRDDQVHRRWRDVRDLIDSSPMSESARTRAHAAFALLAEAEGKVHGMSPEQVTFHEVGALDAIVEVCGVALALDSLGVDEVTCSPLPLGRGVIDGSHGPLPLPAPAVMELLRGAEIRSAELPGETVTPTGAALVASLTRSYGPIPPMKLVVTGTGAGHRDPEQIPNVVRAVLGTTAGPIVSHEEMLVLETNLDDLLPELVPSAVDACLAAGASDVWTTPATMKHGRPGLTLSALVHAHREGAVAEAILRHTSTLGLRVRRNERRWVLPRGFVTVDVSSHNVAVKFGLLDDEVVNIAPEHRDCVRVALACGRTPKAVWAEALAAAHERLGVRRSCVDRPRGRR